MKKINLAISGCLGRMGQQLISSSKSNKSFRLVTLTETKIINKKIAGIKLSLNTDQVFKNTETKKKVDINLDYLTIVLKKTKEYVKWYNSDKSDWKAQPKNLSTFLNQESWDREYKAKANSTYTNIK